jgi:hypothetical protein
MATDAITAHHAQLQQRGLDLGVSQGDEQDAGHGRRFQAYERGRIYWHPTTGAHEVHGRLLQKYLDGGGHDVNPATGERELGFPTSDHSRTEDGLYECATCEWGVIADVSGTPLVRLFGRLYEAWRAEGGAVGRLGHPLTDVTRIESGRAAWFERGVLWHAEGNADVLVGELVLPTLGRPALVDPAEPGAFEWMRFDGAVAVLDARPGLASALMVNRLSLVPVGGVAQPGGLLDAHPDRAATPPAAVGGGTIVDLEPAAALTQRDGRRWLAFILPGVVLSGRARRRRRLGIDGTINEGMVTGTPTPVLERRRLYSLAFRSPGMGNRTISPHCLYARSDWENFGVAHITDLHVSRRIEHYRAKLRATGVPEEDVARLNNWNDAFRDFIRYANHLHAAGLLDVIMATGDLVDYVREVDDHPAGPGNFGFFEALVRGEAPSPDADGPPSEALRVPVFTSLGNHDYRRLPYALGWDASVQTGDFLGIPVSRIPIVGRTLAEIGILPLLLTPGLGLGLDVPGLLLTRCVLPTLVGTVWNHAGLNTTPDEALRLMGLTEDDQTYHVPALRPEQAAPAVQPDPAMRDGTHYYFRRLNPERSYVVRLGAHRLVMLDTRWDEAINDEMSEALFTKLGFGSESDENFVAVNPDSVGVTAEEVKKLRAVLDEEGTEGLVVVGMHAPPLNPRGNDFSNFLRETVHPTNDEAQMLGFLARNAPEASLKLAQPAPVGMGEAQWREAVVSRMAPGWPRTGTPYFHSGPIEDMLDYGIAVGQQEALAQLIAGHGARRAPTMVCCGHGHYRIESRLRWSGSRSQLEAYTDHYLANPEVSYPTRLVEGDWWRTETHKRYLVRVQEGAPPEGEVGEKPFESTIWEGATELRVPPYPTPLAKATDTAAWWQTHGPVVVQTGALGPCTNTRATLKVNKVPPGPNFQGFRLMQVVGNVIAKAQYVTMPELRGATFPLPSERGGAPSVPTQPSAIEPILLMGFFIQPAQPGTPPPPPGGPTEVARHP